MADPAYTRKDLKSIREEVIDSLDCRRAASCESICANCHAKWMRKEDEVEGRSTANYYLYLHDLEFLSG